MNPFVDAESLRDESDKEGEDGCKSVEKVWLLIDQAERQAESRVDTLADYCNIVVDV